MHRWDTPAGVAITNNHSKQLSTITVVATSSRSSRRSSHLRNTHNQAGSGATNKLELKITVDMQILEVVVDGINSKGVLLCRLAFSDVFLTRLINGIKKLSYRFIPTIDLYL